MDYSAKLFLNISVNFELMRLWFYGYSEKLEKRQANILTLLEHRRPNRFHFTGPYVFVPYICYCATVIFYLFSRVSVSPLKIHSFLNFE